MAEHAHNTARPAPAIPTIADLGRYLAWLAKTAVEIEDAGPGVDDPRPNLLFKQEDGIQRAIAARPAASLQDAAVQIGVACEMIRTLESSDWSRPDLLPSLEEGHRNVHRLLLSALPFVASAAGLDMDAMAWSDRAELRAERFGDGSAFLGLQPQH